MLVVCIVTSNNYTSNLVYLLPVWAVWALLSADLSFIAHRQIIITKYIILYSSLQSTMVQWCTLHATTIYKSVVCTYKRITQLFYRQLYNN